MFSPQIDLSTKLWYVLSWNTNEMALESGLGQHYGTIMESGLVVEQGISAITDPIAQAIMHMCNYEHATGMRNILPSLFSLRKRK